VSEYFADYEREFDLKVRRPVLAQTVTDGGERLIVTTTDGTYATRALINATGTWKHPYLPYVPGIETFPGAQIHVVNYQGAPSLAGKRVAVVGAGTSAVEILLELQGIAETTWFTRRPPLWFDGPFSPEHGRRVVASVDERIQRGESPGSVVGHTGLPLTQTMKKGIADGILVPRAMFAEITADLPFDVILWATGFRPAVRHLAPLKLRTTAGAFAAVGTRAVAEPRLFLAGYGPSASTIGATRAGRQAAIGVRELLAGARSNGEFLQADR
jgi:cation diffusion facilitator CzcD-associated flavoprotein CzcO